MNVLEDFETIAGFRWGAYLDRAGNMTLSQRAPEGSEKKIGLVMRVIIQGPFKFTTSDLIFDQGKTLIRKFGSGMLMLFCDLTANIPLIDAILADESPTSISLESSVNSDTRLSVSSMSTVMSISQDTRPVPEELIEELQEMYTSILGPLAKALARKITKKAGIDLELVPRKDWSKLLNVLAEKISDDGKREQFLDRAIMLKTRF